MKRKLISQFNKKKLSGFAAALLAAVLVFVALGADRTPPEEKTDTSGASEMYVTTKNLAYDESLLQDVHNANINSSQSGAQQQEEEQESEESQEQQAEERQEQEESRQGEQQTRTQESQGEQAQELSVTDSFRSLIKRSSLSGVDPDNISSPGGGSDPGENGGGGEGGGSLTLDEGQASDLFYTTITNGEIVDSSDYSFRVFLTAKGKKLSLIAQTVSVNGKQKDFRNGDSIKLKEGANKVRVALRFRDAGRNQIDAAKNYTVYFYKSDHYYLIVENADTGASLGDGSTVTSYQPSMRIKVYAMHAGKAIRARVRLNGSTVSEASNDIYALTLKLGGNTLSITAGSGVNQINFSCTINYRTEVFSIELESDGSDDTGRAIDDIITPDIFGRQKAHTWTSDNQTFRFRISFTQVTGKEQLTYVGITKNGYTTDVTARADARGYIATELEAFGQDQQLYKGNIVYAEFTDSDGIKQSFTWVITYQRVSTPAYREPSVFVGLANGQKVNELPFSVPVKAFDWRGNELMPDNFTVSLNGQVLSFSSITPQGYEYALYSDEGPNTLVVTVTDNEQYTVTRTINYTFSHNAETVYVNLSVSADVLGLGSLISETSSATSGMTVAELVEERLAAYGYSAGSTGSGSDYFLNRIYREGILKGWNLTDEQKARYSDEGYDIYPPADVNSLGSKDITAGSGWMVTVNGIFIGNSMGSTYIRDGDDIRLMFTLDLGKDIGVDTY